MEDRDAAPAGRRRYPSLVPALDELAASVRRDRWGLGLMAVGWVHLATFLACEALFVSGDRRSLPYLALWGVELFAVVTILRRVVTANGRRRAPELTGLLARVWITVMILKFNAVSLNTLMGMETMHQEWFKPMWGTLGTFGFAMMAWLTTPWFLLPAVQMSLTAALLVKNPLHAYLIYGVSWWLALHIVGGVLEYRRRQAEAAERATPLPNLQPRTEAA